jgi:hypothetical protein
MATLRRTPKKKSGFGFWEDFSIVDPEGYSYDVLYADALDPGLVELGVDITPTDFIADSGLIELGTGVSDTGIDWGGIWSTVTGAAKAALPVASTVYKATQSAATPMTAVQATKAASLQPTQVSSYNQNMVAPKSALSGNSGLVIGGLVLLGIGVMAMQKG